MLALFSSRCLRNAFAVERQRAVNRLFNPGARLKFLDQLQQGTTEHGGWQDLLRPHRCRDVTALNDVCGPVAQVEPPGTVSIERGKG